MEKKNYVLRVLVYQGAGFLLIAAYYWIFDVFCWSIAPCPINWNDLLFKNVFILIVATTVMILSGRVISPLYRLEGFLRLCAWCKAMHNEGEWIPLEENLRQEFEIETSHGICPECYAGARKKLKNPKSV